MKKGLVSAAIDEKDNLKALTAINGIQLMSLFQKIFNSTYGKSR